MWEDLAKYKNNFLQTELKYLPAQRINEMQSKEMNKFQHKRQFENCNVINRKWHGCKSAKYFENRAQLGYGLWALPKLMKELGSDDAEVRWKAITSMGEYIINHLHGQRAITEEDIVRRVQNVFLRFRLKFQKERYREVEGLLRIFYLVAMHMNGSKKILHSGRVVNQLYVMVEEREKYIQQASDILQLIVKDADDIYFSLEMYAALDRLANIFGQDVCVYSYPSTLWLHLMAFLELVPDQAVEKGFFEILHTRIKGRLLNYHKYDLRCFALLLRCAEGQKRFVEVDGVRELYEILTNRSKPLDNYEYVVFTLMNGLLAKAVLWRCSSFMDLCGIITNFAKNGNNANMQLTCLKTLRELGEMPSIKRYMRDNCWEDLKKLMCDNEVNQRELNELLYWLEREIYHTTDIRAYKRSPQERLNEAPSN